MEEKSSVNYKIYDKNKDELWKHFNDMITFVMSLGKDAVCKKCLEKEMAIHSSTLAWRIPWTEEPGRLQIIGSQSRT